MKLALKTGGRQVRGRPDAVVHLFARNGTAQPAEITQARSGHNTQKSRAVFQPSSLEGCRGNMTG
ncbi:MAG: hypothetical protein BWX80_04249 [Candidatus Hydrogenedentes bacterium ADurb.Bin101]|nr:MAG: hypothetical protein BWX80_04249 [Candidatus Hydrogenedentes bacterium ADurb.Bin101]